MTDQLGRERGPQGTRIERYDGDVLTDRVQESSKRKGRARSHRRKGRNLASNAKKTYSPRSPKKKIREKKRKKKPKDSQYTASSVPITFDTGLIPVLAAVTSKQQYQTLQQPFPLHKNEINDFTAAVLPPGAIEYSEAKPARMWIIARLYSVDDYLSRDLGDQLADAAHLFMSHLDELPLLVPASNILVVYSSTGRLHNVPSPVFKPYPQDLPQNSVYLVYMGIPFGIFGTERQITKVSERLVDNYTEDVSERTRNFLHERLGVETFPFLPTVDAYLPELLEDLEQDLQTNLLRSS
ncbi:MAG: hypothetical protein ACFFGZ_18815 [Candidatus Thorarchaeota archaeon]